MPGWINVPMKIETRNRLEKIRKDDESFDKIVNKLCDNYEHSSEFIEHQNDHKEDIQ